MHDYSTAVLKHLRAAIADAGGREVFFSATTDANQSLIDVATLARGNATAVPAILKSVAFGDVVIHNHPSGNLEPSPADLEIAGHLGGLGVGFHIVDNSVESVYRVVEAFASTETKSLHPAQIEEILGRDGCIAALLPGYEERPEQLRMAQTVGDAFNRDRIAVIEAGTGTGKSLAYLVPAILWSKQNRERVIVATRTINLQEQLMRKDLPLLKEASGLDFHAVLVKGRGNYLCRRRLQITFAETGLFDEQQLSELKSLLAWSEKSATGDREELTVTPEESLWEEVRCEADQCARAHCAHYASCFFYKARRQAAQADLLVVNHALLLADLSLRRSTDNYGAVSVLPPSERIILDEAHHLEDVATSYFSSRSTRFTFARILNRLRHPRKPERGVLPRFLVLLGNRLPDHYDTLYRSLHEQIELLTGLRQQLLDNSLSLFERLGLGLAARLEKQVTENEELRHRVVPAFRGTAFWHDAVTDIRALAKQTKELAAALRIVIDLCAELPKELDEHFISPQTDLGGIGLRLNALAADLGQFVVDDAASCAWFEVRQGRVGRGQGVITAFCVAPLGVANLLNETLFERSKTVVMTSATLTVNNNFDYLKRRIGLDRLPSQRLLESLLASPFDYQTQALLAAPKDIPMPGDRGYAEMLTEQIEQAILAADGRTFVLFTAYSMLRRVHAELAPILEARGYRCLRQGEMNRHRLLQEFSKDSTSVLFGTDSFWEGVDVPGRALEQVIIARLPFRVPSEPVLEARAESIEQSGGDPFMDYTVPQAVIRFKQGFGRLIRHRNDRGVVLILDARVSQRHYGRLFVRSLPDVTYLAASTVEVQAAVKTFFATARAGIEGEENR
ncbi:MAG: DEAD/DEAH box helicase [Desulfuromonadales bacterium]|nr:DEAD/DEAH box helicase [Desulfuromonadales bacterium]